MEFTHCQGMHKLLIRTGNAIMPARKLLNSTGTVDTGVKVENLAT